MRLLVCAAFVACFIACGDESPGGVSTGGPEDAAGEGATPAQSEEPPLPPVRGMVGASAGASGGGGTAGSGGMGVSGSDGVARPVRHRDTIFAVLDPDTVYLAIEGDECQLAALTDDPQRFGVLPCGVRHLHLRLWDGAVLFIFDDELTRLAGDEVDVAEGTYEEAPDWNDLVLGPLPSGCGLSNNYFTSNPDTGVTRYHCSFSRDESPCGAGECDIDQWQRVVEHPTGPYANGYGGHAWIPGGVVQPDGRTLPVRVPGNSLASRAHPAGRRFARTDEENASARVLWDYSHDGALSFVARYPTAPAGIEVSSDCALDADDNLYCLGLDAGVRDLHHSAESSTSRLRNVVLRYGPGETTTEVVLSEEDLDFAFGDLLAAGEY